MPRHEPGAARSRAVATAADLFYAKGTATVSLDDVARAAGVAKNTLYAHFASKEELAAAALGTQGEALLGAVHEGMDAAGDDPTARVLAAFGVVDAMAARPGYRGCPYLNAAAQNPEPSVHEQVHAHKDELRAIFRHEAVRAGHADPGAAADELLLLLDGAMVQAATRPETRPVATAQRLARSVLGTR